MLAAARARRTCALGATAARLQAAAYSQATGAAGAAGSSDRDSSLLQQTLRADLAAEEAATALFRGQRAALCGRPDAAALAEREQAHLDLVRALAPAHRVRPPLLAPALRAGFFALGAAAGLAPRRVSAAVTAGLQDALTDMYNEQLRELRAAGLSDAAPRVRAAVVALRDEERAQDGAPQAPDLLPYLAGSRRLAELTPEEGVAGLVKLGARLSLGLASRL